MIYLIISSRFGPPTTTTFKQDLTVFSTLISFFTNRTKACFLNKPSLRGLCEFSHLAGVKYFSFKELYTNFCHHALWMQTAWASHELAKVKTVMRQALDCPALLYCYVICHVKDILCIYNEH